MSVQDDVIPVYLEPLRALYFQHVTELLGGEPPSAEDWYRFLLQLKALSLVTVTELSANGRHH